MSNADMPAMPQPVTLDAYCFNGDITVAPDYDTDYMGLTKREHFAGLAMQGMIASPIGKLKDVFNGTSLANAAVDQADALLKALETRHD